MTSLAALRESMLEAIDRDNAAEYFQSAGMWGMALALYGKFIEMGLEPELCYMPAGDETRVWVHVARTSFDYRGAVENPAPMRFWLMEEWIPAMALRYHEIDEDQLSMDIDRAEALLEKTFPASFPDLRFQDA